MEGKVLSILNLLLQSHQSLKANDIADKLGISTRTVMRYMNIISNDKDDSFDIFSSKNNGYKLVINDNDKFNKYLNNQRQELVINEQNIKIMIYIGLHNNVSVNDLSDIFNYSTSSINRIIQQLNEILGDRLIYIDKNKDNLKLIGNEIKIRNYLTIAINRYYDYTLEICSGWEMYYEHIKNILFENGIEYKTINNLIYLVTTLIRYSNDNKINLTKIVRLIYRNDSLQFKIINDLKQSIYEDFNIELSNDECTYLQVLLLKPDTEILDYNEMFGYIKPIIIDAIENIDNKYNTSFKDNNELIESLNYHVSNCFEDYILMTDNDNELLEQIKINYTNEYCYAIEFKKWIYQVLDIEIGDKDIGYIALHFANCLEFENEKTILKAQIIYKSNKTVASLLMTKINNMCNGVYVDRIYKSSDIPNNINDYDINFAFDNYKNNSLKFFKINAFLNYKDLENINSEVIKINGLNELLKMFKEELFYTGIEVENKRNLLEILLNDLKIKNYLDDSECEQVLEREKLTSTEIAMDVAFPHVIVKSDSFLSFVILKRPIFWRNNYIKIVVLMGISNGDTDAKNAIQYLFSRLANENVVSEIERSNKYDDVLKIIREKDVC